MAFCKEEKGGMKKTLGLSQKAPKLYSYPPATGEARENFNSLFSSLVLASVWSGLSDWGIGSGVDIGVGSRRVGE